MIGTITKECKERVAAGGNMKLKPDCEFDPKSSSAAIVSEKKLRMQQLFSNLVLLRRGQPSVTRIVKQNGVTEAREPDQLAGISLSEMV